MTLVVDASTVTAALVDGGPDGRWAEELLRSGGLSAPHLMQVEVANVLRRATLTGELSPEVAALAHADLLALQVHLYAYEPLAGRVWALRSNLTAYDACYVALAELLGERLATLDARIIRATGPRCRFLHPTR